MINILNLLGIGDAIVQALRTFMCWIAAGIYSLIENVYHIFELLGRAEIVENEFIQQIYSKVGMILGIFMVFKLVFSLIQSLVDPDKLNDKKNGFAQIILRIIIAIALLGLTPTIFREAYNIQNFIVGGRASDNVLYKLIAGSNTNGNIETIGRTLSSELYFGFYSDNEEPFLNQGMIDKIYSESEDPSIYEDRFQQDNYGTLKNNVIDGKESFYATVDYVAIKDKNEYVIEVNWIPLLFVGIFVLYIIAVYCIQVGIRVVQLAYLQLIAPIPILSYISDPEGSFKKWTKQCITTYLDLFIRLAIIYFVMSLISDILAAISDSKGILYESTNMADEPWLVQWLVVSIIIVGLLMFAKKVPELLKDLFPNLGGGAASLSFGLNPKAMFKDTLVAKGAGLIGGAATGAAVGLIGGHGFGGRVKGLFGGITKGASSGYKGKKLSEIASARAAQNVKNRKIRDSESTFGGRMNAKLRDTFGMESKTGAIDRQTHDIDINNIRPIDDAIHDIDERNIRPIDNRIAEINRDAVMEDKRRNDAIISARKAIMDKAESELLKKNRAVQSAKLRAEYLRENLGKVDSVTGKVIDSKMVLGHEAGYRTLLKSESLKWVELNATSDAEIARNMQIMSDEAGYAVNSALLVESAGDAAKNANVGNAAYIAKLEFEKQELERQKQELERQKHDLERQKQDHEQRKTELNRQKEKPQADEDAIKK